VFGAAGSGPSTKEFPAVKTGAAKTGAGVAGAGVAGAGMAGAGKGAGGKAGASTAGGSGGRDGRAGGGVAGAWQRSSPPQRKLVAGAAVLMVAAAVAIAVVSFVPNGKPGAGSHNAASTGTDAAGGVPAGQPSPGPAPSGSHHKAGHHKPAKHHHPGKKPKASPSPSPSPSPKKPRHHPHPGPQGIARLTASVGVSGPPRGGRDARVTYAASNIGNAATARLAASITLPAGAVLAHDWEVNGGAGGWDCHSGGHQVICRHSSVPKDNQVVGSFSIVVRSRTACGQPVTFSVDGGTARTEAQSSALIQCSNAGFGAVTQAAALTTQSAPSSGLQLTAFLARPLAL